MASSSPSRPQQKRQESRMLQPSCGGWGLPCVLLWICASVTASKAQVSQVVNHCLRTSTSEALIHALVSDRDVRSPGQSRVFSQAAMQLCCSVEHANYSQQSRGDRGAGSGVRGVQKFRRNAVDVILFLRGRYMMLLISFQSSVEFSAAPDLTEGIFL